MSAYYNEIDPFAVEWLKALISEGHIAQGDVDDRSIKEVRASDLNGYTQCHFFAGIGVWSYALRQAGITDDTPAWTGSCPCQPFSAAGQRKGIDDERHLWPELYRLVKECRPPRIVGEQVAGKGGTSWFDLVQAELAQENYAAGLVVFPACSIGAPHQRQRLYWVAEDILADSTDYRSEFWQTDGDQGRESYEGEQVVGQNDESAAIGCSEIDRFKGVVKQTYSYWADPDWLYCRDGKWRPVESSTFPLVDGSPNRVGRLRGYGNAIVAPQAQAFIEAVFSL